MQAQARQNPVMKIIAEAKKNGHTIVTPAIFQQEAQKMMLRGSVKEDVAELQKQGKILRLVSSVGARPLLAPAREARDVARVVRYLRAQVGPRGVLPLSEGEDSPPLYGLSQAQSGALRALAIRAEIDGLLTGGPGTGKSFTTSKLIHHLEAAGRRVYLMAPTGKAGEVLARKVNRPVFTIHTTIGLRPGGVPSFNRHNQLPTGTYVIDESSMVDEELFSYVVDGIGVGSRLVLVGDPHQLPPVGAGNPFKDLLRNNILPHFHLTEIFRQEAGNSIIELANQILAGKVEGVSSDVEVHECPVNRTEDWAFHYWLKHLRHLPSRDYLILSAFREDRPGSANNLSMRIQSYLAETEHRKPVHDGPKCKYYVGDRIIFSVNDPNVGYVNGTMGVIKASEPYGRSSILTIETDNGQQYEIPYSDLREKSELGYATTVHKAQGSEAKHVLLVLPAKDSMVFSRSLLYTAVTRPQERLTIIGSMQALHTCVAKDPPRETLLAHLLQDQGLVDQIEESTSSSQELAKMWASYGA